MSEWKTRREIVYAVGLAVEESSDLESGRPPEKERERAKTQRKCMYLVGFHSNRLLKHINVVENA